MRYMGSKARIARHILPVILEGRRPGQWYVEPFVGLANVIHLVGGRRIGADSNGHVITLLKALQSGFVPPNSVSKREYEKLRVSKEVTPLRAFVGFGCSFGGKWFGGYARNDANNDYCLQSKRSLLKQFSGIKGAPRNDCAESARSLTRQAPGVKGVRFVHSDYADLAVPANSVVYCDPPYGGTTGYGAPFDHAEFWEWARAMSAAGHRVFVSEYAAPDDFRCVWERKVRMQLRRKDNNAVRTERLFVHESQRRDQQLSLFRT